MIPRGADAGVGHAGVLRFCDLARERGFQVRFIEFMPLDGDRSWRAPTMSAIGG